MNLNNKKLNETYKIENKSDENYFLWEILNKI